MSETEVLHLTDKAVMSFLASLAQTLREIDTLQRNAAKMEEDLATVFCNRLREFVLEGLHKDLDEHDLEAMRNMVVALDALRTQATPIMKPMPSTPH